MLCLTLDRTVFRVPVAKKPLHLEENITKHAENKKSTLREYEKCPCARSTGQIESGRTPIGIAVGGAKFNSPRPPERVREHVRTSVGRYSTRKCELA